MNSRREVDPSRRMVILPRLYLWVGTICGVSFTTMAVMAISGFGISSWWANVELSGFALLGFYIAMISVNFRIQYDEKGFCFRTVFRRTCAFEYQDIVKIWRSQYFLHIKTSSHHLYIDRKAIGFHGFIEAINLYGQPLEERPLRAKKCNRSKKRA